MPRPVRRVLPALLIGIAIVLSVIVPRQLVTLTSTGQDREWYDLSLPGLDIGIDVIPATPGRAGYLEVWCYPHSADDIVILFAIPGAPALPRVPAWETDTIEA